MLCQFTVKNFRSIQDEITLDMQASGITENDHSLLKDIDGEEFLPLAVIYGPNGSGKSTVLLALYSLICKIMRPICAVSCDHAKECQKISDSALIKPFKFDKEAASAPTEFEMFFRTSICEYQYQLSVLKDKVVTEYLYKKKLDGARYSNVFARVGNKISLKGSLNNYDINDISDNITLLSYLGITHRRNKIIRDIISWIDNKIQYIDYSNPAEEAQIAITDNQKIKPLVLKMLEEMDIGISNYRIERKEEKIKVFTSHTINGKNHELELREESNGTIKVFGILPFIADSILNGTTLVIDELDAKLHPLLLKYIINLFSNPEINKKRSQLLFTSHDLSTMNHDNFRRDEIWFVAKGKNLSSKMYSLVEFKNEDGKPERKDAIYNKRYIEGRYGADPYLKRIIDWGSI